MSSDKSTYQVTKPYLYQQKEDLIMKLNHVKELKKGYEKKLDESKKEKQKCNKKIKIMVSWRITS